MGTGYTRTNTADITASAVVKSAPINAELNAVVSAFAASTGHTHDGTSAEGGPITSLLGNTLTFGAGTAGTDITITFDGETNDGVLKWMEDEDYFEFSDDILIASNEKLQFRDTGLYIHSNADGDLDIVSDGTASNAINLDSAGGITLDADTASEGITYADNGTAILQMFHSSSDVIFKNKVDAKDIVFQQYDGNEVMRIADNRKVYFFDEGGEHISSDGTDFTFESGNDINLTATTDINVPANVGVTFGDDGEKIEGDGTNLTISSSNNLTIDAAGDIILDADGADVTLKDGGTTFGSLTNSSGELVIKSGSTPTTAMTFSGANVTFAGTITIGSAGISETELEILDGATATTAELNILDGDTSATSTTIADADRLVLNDNGTMVQVAVTDLAAYLDDEITAMPNLVTTGALDSGSITSGFGNIDNGASNITSGGLVKLDVDADADDLTGDSATGRLTIGAGEDLNLYHGGTNSYIVNDTGDLILDTADDIVLDADGGDIFFKDGGTTFGSATNTSGNLILKSGTTTALTFDGANVTVAGNLTVSGTQTVVDTVTMNAANAIVFEGATADDHETTLTITDPTADRTIKLPNQSGTLPVLAADSDTAITSTPAELNIMDGGTSASSITVADADRLVINDDGTMKQIAVTTLAAYLDDEITAMPNLVTTAATTVGALGSGSITTGFGNIDNGASNITTGGLLKIDVDADADDLTGDSTTGRLTLGAGEDLNLYHGGTNSYIVNDTGDLIIDTAGDVVLDADGGDTLLKDAGTQYAALTNTSGNLIIKSGSTTALTFSGADVTSAGTVTYGSLSDGSITITAFVDEDNMSSNSATLVPTQQSVKAYVDSVAGSANNVTGLNATGAELNTVADFSAVSVDTSTAIANNDAILMFDNGNNIGYRDVDLLVTYMESTIDSLSSLTTTGALNSGSIASGFGAIDNGTSGIRTNTFTAETSIVPDASGGADIGSTSAEWGDVYIADDKYIQFGNDQNVLVGYDEDGDDSLEIRQNVEGAALAITFKADQGDDNADQWKLNFADGGTVTFQSKTSGSYATKQTLDTSGNFTVTGELDGASLDISGNADIEGTVNALRFLPEGDTSAGESAAVGYQSSEGIVITGQGSTFDVTLKNDADTAVYQIQTGTTNSIFHGVIAQLIDDSSIYFGGNSEIHLTHVHDTGLTLTNTISGTDNRPMVLQLKSEEDAIVADDVIASIEMAAGDSDGTDGATVAAGIHAIAEGTFSASANATKLVFTTGVSETAASSATAKMTLSSGGNLTVAGQMDANTLSIDSTAITSTAAEINLLDGGTSVGSSITLADADGFVVNDGGTMKTIPASDVKTYASGSSASKGFAIAMAIVFG
jgi:hypothetical protein